MTVLGLKVPDLVLEDPVPHFQASVVWRRMSWASHRQVLGLSSRLPCYFTAKPGMGDSELRDIWN